MAQSDANEVAQILSRGYQTAIANRQFQQEQAERVREAQANEAYRQQQAETQQKQFDAQQQAAEKLFKLQQSKAEFDQAMQSVPFGMTPSGFIEAPPGPNAAPSAQRMRILTTPSGGTVEVPSVGMYNAQRTAEQQAILGPQQQFLKDQAAAAFDQQNKMEMLRIGMEAHSQWQQHKDYMQVLGSQQQFQKEQLQREIDSRKALESDKNTMMLQMYGLKQQAKASSIWGSTTGLDDEGNVVITPNDPTQRIAQGVNDVRDGKLSLEAAKKEFPGQQFASFDQAVKNQGYQYLSQKDQQGIKELETLAGLPAEMYNLFKLRLDNKAFVNVPNFLGGSADQFNAQSDIVKGHIAGAATTINQIKRFNGMEAKAMQNALTPSTDVIMHGGASEFEKYTAFTKDLQDLLNTKLSDLPEKQRNIIRQNLGFNSFPYLGSLTKTPGAPVNAIPGATPPSMQQGGTPAGPKSGQIFVHNKQTGQDGWMSRQYFDPKKYEYAKPPGVQ